MYLYVGVSSLSPSTIVMFDYSGDSVSTAGDVNGDGLDDLIVGAYNADPNNQRGAGKSYDIFGKTDTDTINLLSIRVLLPEPVMSIFSIS
jgi:hypothetical protein